MKEKNTNESIQIKSVHTELEEKQQQSYIYLSILLFIEQMCIENLSYAKCSAQWRI